MPQDALINFQWQHSCKLKVYYKYLNVSLRLCERDPAFTKKTFHVLSDKAVKLFYQYMHHSLSRWVITVLFFHITRTLRGAETDCMLITH